MTNVLRGGGGGGGGCSCYGLVRLLRVPDTVVVFLALKNSSNCFPILYVEDSWEAILVQCDYIEGPPRPPSNNENFTLWPIHENWYRVVIFSLDVNMSAR